MELSNTPRARRTDQRLVPDNETTTDPDMLVNQRDGENSPSIDLRQSNNEREEVPIPSDMPRAVSPSRNEASSSTFQQWRQNQDASDSGDDDYQDPYNGGTNDQRQREAEQGEEEDSESDSAQESESDSANEEDTHQNKENHREQSEHPDPSKHKDRNEGDGENDQPQDGVNDVDPHVTPPSYARKSRATNNERDGLPPVDLSAFNAPFSQLDSVPPIPQNLRITISTDGRDRDPQEPMAVDLVVPQAQDGTRRDDPPKIDAAASTTPASGTPIAATNPAARLVSVAQPPSTPAKSSIFFGSIGNLFTSVTGRAIDVFSPRKDPPLRITNYPNIPGSAPSTPSPPPSPTPLSRTSTSGTLQRHVPSFSLSSPRNVDRDARTPLSDSRNAHRDNISSMASNATTREVCKPALAPVSLVYTD